MAELKEIFYQTLRNIAIEENFTNFEVNSESASEKGDNFIGVVLRAEIVGKRKTQSGSEVDDKLSLICKVPPANKARRENFRVDEAFARECIFYNEIAPLFLKFQRDRGLSDEETFHVYPKCYRAIHGEEFSVVVLEDLRSKGFTMWPKRKANNIHNVRKVIGELAKFHAISFAMKDQSPETLKKYEHFKDSFTYMYKSEIIKNATEDMWKSIIENFENSKQKSVYGEIVKDIYKYLRSCSDDSVPTKYFVLGHGDCWNNNILYKFKEVIELIVYQSSVS